MFKKQQQKEIFKQYVVMFYNEVYELDTLAEAQKCCEYFGMDYSEIMKTF